MVLARRSALTVRCSALRARCSARGTATALGALAAGSALTIALGPLAHGGGLARTAAVAHLPASAIGASTAGAAADPPVGNTDRGSRSFMPARAALRQVQPGPTTAGFRAGFAVQRTVLAVPLPGGSLEQLVLADPVDPTRSERVLVWRPPGADSARVPVVYWLHGVPGRPEDFLASGYIASVARAVVTHQLPPVVLAFPDGNSARHADTEWADSASGDQDLATLVSTRVVTAVEGTRRRPAALRTIAGFSMGGFGAADIALHHPEVFGSLISLEGYFHVDDPSGVLGHDPAVLAAHTPFANLGALGSRAVYLADYTDDTEPVVAGESQRLATLLATRGATSQLVTIPGSAHSLAPLADLWPGMVQFLQRTAWRS